MLNRRKATIGWLAYTIGKPVVVGTIKRRARRAAAKDETGGSTGKTVAKTAGLLAAAGAAAGAVVFWRRSSNGRVRKARPSPRRRARTKAASRSLHAGRTAAASLPRADRGARRYGRRGRRPGRVRRRALPR